MVLMSSFVLCRRREPLESQTDPLTVHLFSNVLSHNSRFVTWYMIHIFIVSLFVLIEKPLCACVNTNTLLSFLPVSYQSLPKCLPLLSKLPTFSHRVYLFPSRRSISDVSPLGLVRSWCLIQRPV